MKVFAIYMMLLVFWAESVLGVKLSRIPGLSFSNICLNLLMFLWLMTALKRKRLFKKNNINANIFLVMIVYAFSIIVKFIMNEVPTTIPWEIKTYKSWLNPFLYFLAIYNITEDEKVIKHTVYGLVGLCVLSNISTILAANGIFIGALKASKNDGRVYGFGEPNQYAAYLVLMLPLFLVFFHRGRDSFVKASSGIVCILVLISLFSTGSRGGIIALAASVFFFLFKMKRVRNFTASSLVLILLAMPFFVGISYYIAPDRIKTKMIEKFNYKKAKNMEDFTSGRTLLANNGLEMFKSSPIFGHGQNSYVDLNIRKFHVWGVSHNEYIAVLAEQGLIGLIVVLLLYYKIYKNVAARLAVEFDDFRQTLLVAYLTGLVGYLVAMYGVNLFEPRIPFWIYTAAIFSMMSLSADPKNISGECR